MDRLDNNHPIVVINGDASGIGLATSLAFPEDGADVGVISRTQHSLDQAMQGPLAK